MKKVRNILNVVIAILIVIAVVFTTKNDLTAATTTAPDKIKLGGASSSLPKYIGETYFPIKYTSDGTMVYCLNHKLDLAQNMTVTKVGEMDAGIVYILNHGYPKTKITGNNDKDYYITQTAIWWYLDDTKGTSNLGTGFKSTGQDNNGLRDKVIALKEAAKKNNTYVKPSISTSVSTKNMKLSDDKKYYVSDAISVKTSNVTGNYTVDLTNAPKGTIVTDINNNTKASFGQKEQFIVKVPASSVENAKVSFKVNVSGTGQIEKAYEYKPSSSKVQHIVTTALYYDTTDVSTELSLNAVKNTEIKIVKIDSKTKEPVEKAVLVLKDASGKEIKRWTTTKETEVFTDLAVGEYTVEEVSAPNGYKKSDKVEKFVVANDGGTITVEFANDKYDKTKISILKVDSKTGEPVAKATLTVKNAKGEVVAEWITNKEAQVLENLEVGEYTLEETKAPDNYKKSDEIVKFTVDFNGKTVPIKFANEKFDKTKVSILKVDSKTGEPVADAVLTLKNVNGKEIKTWSTTKEAEEFNDLEVGEYTVEEVSAPKGYKKSNSVEKITVSYDGGTKTVKFANEKFDKTKVSILKVDSETGKPLKDAELVIKNKNGEVVEKWKTTEKAKEFNDLEVGEYTLEETKAPNGYRLSNVKRTFVVDFNGKTETIKYTNDKKDKTIVKVLKVDSKTGEALEGAELVIKDGEGKVVKSWPTTKNEEVFTDLAKGEYILEETKAPEGYKKSDEKISFTVDENDQTIELRFKNEIKPGSVKISKQDITSKKELPGAELVIKDSEGKVVKRWVSTNEPYYINTLEDGTYTLSETIAPEGYELSTETISFEIVSGKVTDTVVMYNRLKPGSVTISKQDITNGEELPGANLEVKDSNGEVVAKWVSSTEPYKIETLEDGTYTLTETIAPKGYVLSSETIEFTITAGKVTDTVIMYNTPETPVPITASSISIFASMLGLSLLALGTKVVYKNVKQN